MASMSTLRLVDIPPEAFVTAASVIPLIGYPFYGNVFEPVVLLAAASILTFFVNSTLFVGWLIGLHGPLPASWVGLLPTIGFLIAIARSDPIVEPYDQPNKVKEDLQNQPRTSGTMAFLVILMGAVFATFKLYNDDLPIMTIQNIAVLLICLGGVPLACVLFREAFLDWIFVPTIARNGPVWHRLREGSVGKAVEIWTLIMYIGSWLGFVMVVCRNSA